MTATEAVPARGRVLLTGATGFLGSHVVGHLLASGYEVHAVARTVPGADAEVSWHAADLLDDRQARALVEELAPGIWSISPGTPSMGASGRRPRTPTG